MMPQNWTAIALNSILDEEEQTTIGYSSFFTNDDNREAELGVYTSKVRAAYAGMAATRYFIEIERSWILYHGMLRPGI